jgi:hypothetical protein
MRDCVVSWLPKTGDSDKFTIEMDGRRVRGFVSGVEQALKPRVAKAVSVIEAIKKYFPDVPLNSLNFIERK